MSSILDLSNLTEALQGVVSNKGSSGVDGMKVSELGEWLKKNRKQFTTQLGHNNYHVSTIRGVKIPKPKGGYRQLGIPTVKDRLVQQSIKEVLEDIMTRHFRRAVMGSGKVGEQKVA